MIHFFILILNCLIFNYIRRLVRRTVPTNVWLFLFEAISTLELCAGCAELGVIWENYGTTVYAALQFFFSIWWSLQFGEAEACPCGPLEDYILFDDAFQRHDIYARLLGQLLGAFLTAKYRKTFWYFNMVSQNVNLDPNQCKAALQVSMSYGFVIETIITFISRLVSLESHNWPENYSLLVNSIVTVGLCISAMHTSGGFFNPILASALTFNCRGNTIFEHFIVYWFGALIGGIMARFIHTWIHVKPKIKAN